MKQILSLWNLVVLLPQRRTRARGLAMVLAVLTAAITVVAAPGSGAAAPSALPGAVTVADPPPCTPYYVIGLRGSGESLGGPFQMGTRTGAYVEKAAALLPADRTAYYSLPYPAKSPGLEYDRSVSDGVLALTAVVRSRIIDCPGIRIGLVGYSQGAHVINNTLARLSAAELTQIGSVLLLADPFSAGDTAYDITMTVGGEPADPARGGILKRQQLPQGIWNRATDFCIKGDPVCDSENVETVLDLIIAAFLFPIHSRYDRCCGSFNMVPVLGEAFARRLLNVPTPPADNLPNFCRGTKDGKVGTISCDRPIADDVRWIGFARCRTPWGAGEAVWWQRSEEVRGVGRVTITCDDTGAPNVRVDMLSWEQVI